MPNGARCHVGKELKVAFARFGPADSGYHPSSHISEGTIELSALDTMQFVYYAIQICTEERRCIPLVKGSLICVSDRRDT
eukprot:scaffold162226_cov48-Tisochrysis_lutea.AAC.1